GVHTYAAHRLWAGRGCLERGQQDHRGGIGCARYFRDSLRLGVACSNRWFIRSLKDLEPMVKGSGFMGDWIEVGVARGEARGRTEEARSLAVNLLSKRFGALPEALVKHIQAAEKEWCERLLERAMEVETLAELEWEQ